MPRYKGIQKIKSLKSQVRQMQEVASQIKKDKEVIMSDINKIQSSIEEAIMKIKVWDL